MARLPMATRIPLAQAMQQPALLPKLQVLQAPTPRASDRLIRKPSHDFHTWTRPWDIQPVAIVPVLPGDTLVNMMLQARAVTDPVLNRVGGWWNEFTLYYVPHTCLGTDDEGTQTTADAIREMHLTNAATGLAATTERLHNYHGTAGGTQSAVDWVHECMKQIVRWYHRDGEEPITGYGNAGERGTDIYKARVRDLMWLDSCKIEDVNPSGQGDLAVGEDFNDVFVPTAFATHYAQWEHMRQLNLLPESVTFDDYLRSWGVSVPREEDPYVDRPEVLRYVREWQYPSNTIDPADGSAVSAVSWGIQARADKPRRFPLPGFLVVTNVVRPKVYYGNQSRNASTMLDNAYGWLPAILARDPYTSLIEFDHDEGPIAGIPNSADDYWIDMRDLYVRGDQFLNFAPADVTRDKCNIVDLPSSSGDNVLNIWYPSETDTAAVFVDNAGTEIEIETDGVIKFNIKSAEHASRDHT